jgi:hypothetical protein
MSTPSLLNIPYLYKAGTLYSQIPESGAGDFTVQRTTTVANRSTRINKDGLIETVLDNVPRLDYPLGGAVNGCPALLVEPSARNDCFQSQGFSTSPWIAAGVSAVSTALTNSPDGTQNAFDVTISNTGFSNLRQTIACANNTTYTISCFYKNKALTAGQTFEMRYTNENIAPNNLNAIATIDLAAGTASYNLTGTAGTGFSGTATGRVENYGNGWYRISMTFTTGSAGANASGIFRPVVGISIARNFFAWGAQMETSSVPTSYIPTTTAAVTRSGDLISDTTATALIGQTEGTVYLEMQADAAGTGQNFLYVGNNASDSIVIGKSGVNCFFEFRVNGTPLISQNVALSGTVIKGAIAYANGNYAAYANGNLLASGTTSRTPANALTAIAFSNFINLPTINAASAIMRVRAFELHPNRIPNTAAPGVLSLATLTAP